MKAHRALEAPPAKSMTQAGQALAPKLGRPALWRRFAAMWVVFAAGSATAQGPKTPSVPATPVVAQKDMQVLQGAWARPDGGYIILIKGIGADGTLDALYFNPNPLPFALARASQEGGILRASFELRAGGYGGSTYELAYDPTSDKLKGVYHQAVAKQKFDVQFARK